MSLIKGKKVFQDGFLPAMQDAKDGYLFVVNKKVDASFSIEECTKAGDKIPRAPGYSQFRDPLDLAVDVIEEVFLQ
ncbi:hypothetical protein J2X76_000256 [Neorhizobium sp. 2083]|uniref:hypothetical protein n=1 Tax=Neorhizobium sp. 2083 TaxID=2817762 RepID=UPI002854B770|nr:hypothetical protein [Neorhizobium sp. 2083]MDR6815102.1 hypothetical protein [Neorhizobium sp. 2083]